ncbi:MAG: alpha/beta fold hydrolase [Candidatus Binataceae bacterium]
MTRSRIAAAIFASLILLILTGRAFSAEVSSLVGDWQGTLDPEGASLRLVIHITIDSAGKLNVSLDSIDQRAYGLSGTDLVLDGREVSFLFPSVNGSYHGTMSGDGRRITGEWSQGSIQPLDLRRIGLIARFAHEEALLAVAFGAFVALWFFGERIARTPESLPRLPALVAVAPLLLICMLLGAGYLYEKRSEAHDAQTFRPLGKLVDVGGRRLQLYCIGNGTPTVVIETGMGTPSYFWVPVQNGVAKYTHVCTYDRAGFGWSDPSPKALSMSERVAELHTLLTNAHVDGPYVMVGHSYGGALMRLFVHNYPQDIAGLVLVESSEEGFAAEPVAKTYLATNGNALENRIRESRFGLVRFELRKSSPLERAASSSPAFWKETFDENNSMNRMAEEMKGTEAPGEFGGLPLVVIRRGQSNHENVSGMTPEQFEQKWQAAQERLVKLSTNSDLIVAWESGHNVEFTQPDLIVAQIDRVVTAVRDHTPLN